MKLPKKIDDRIRDSLVQVVFKSGVPFEPLVGYIYAALTSIEYQYINQSLNLPGISLPHGLGAIHVNGGTPIFIDAENKIKIQISPHGVNTSITFNSIAPYIGWENYLLSMEKVIKCLLKEKIMSSVSRIGIRYINEFNGVNILEKLNYKFQLDSLNVPANEGKHRIEWNDTNYRYVVNFTSLLPIQPILTATTSEQGSVSLLDIDVINEKVNDESSAKKIIQEIEKTHVREKTIFWSLLKEDFRKTLNPKY
jgi:uncharacterized protein (TIGR04255 family)